MILGIDYASVDGNHISPAETGAKFAYIRASAGLQRDPTWEMHRAIWAAHQIPAGAYHALAWHTDPIAQAKAFVACAGERQPGEMPFALDIEADSATELGMTPAVCLAHAEAVLRELVAEYDTVVIYTSARVWGDVMGGLPSAAFGACPLWLKVPYAWNARNPPHLESRPARWATPAPWRQASSAGTWMLQFQGDALGLPGATSTVDLNGFLAPVNGWAGELLKRAGFSTCQGVVESTRRFQAAHGLVTDGIIGPKTFAALTLPRP